MKHSHRKLRGIVSFLLVFTMFFTVMSGGALAADGDAAVPEAVTAPEAVEPAQEVTSAEPAPTPAEQAAPAAPAESEAQQTVQPEQVQQNAITPPVRG